MPDILRVPFPADTSLVALPQPKTHMVRLKRIARLPDELLLDIFRRLSFWDRVRAAIVCHQWRSASLGAVATLWTDIPHLRNVDTYRHLLARSGNYAITLTFHPDDLSNIVTFCDILSQSVRRVKCLRLALPIPDDEEESRYAAECLEGILGAHAPLLQTLFLSDPGQIISRMHSPFLMLGNPMLRHVELEGFALASLTSCATSPVVRSLKVSTPDDYDVLPSADWSLLSSFPALEALALHLPRTIRVDVPPTSPRLPRSLQHVRLEVHPDCLDALAALDDLSRFQTLQIACISVHPEFNRLAGALPFLTHKTVSAAVHVGTSHASMMAEDDRGRKRIIRNLTFSPGWHTLLPNVTRLWIDVFPLAPLGDTSTTAIVFPALEELTLDVTDPLSFAAGGPPAISSPRLRVVRFVSAREQPPIPADAVLDYLMRSVHACAPRPWIERLILDGLALEHSQQRSLDVTALHAVAGNTSIVCSRTVWPEAYRSWGVSDV